MMKFIKFLKELWKSPHAKYIFPFILLLISYSVACFLSKGSFHDKIWGSFDWMIQNGIPLCLAALGAGLVLASGGVDISSAGVATMGGVLMAICLNQNWHVHVIVDINLGFFVGILIATSFGIISGISLGWTVCSRNAPPLISSWALGIIWLTAALVLSSSIHEKIPQADASGVYVSGLIFSTKNSKWYLIAILAVAQILHYSGLPRRACAIGANRDSAVYAGISINRTTISCYVFSGILSSLSGIVWLYYSGKAGTSDFIGKEITAISVAVIGGTVMSGGYLNVFSIIAASFFFSNFKKITNNMHFTNVPQEQLLINTIFSLTFLILMIVWGRKINGITHPIQVERNTKQQ